MNKFFFLFAISLSTNAVAQDQPVILESYPIGQDFYVGKMKGLHQDIKNASVKLQLPACDLKERYRVAVLVESTGAIKFVKDDDSLNIAKNGLSEFRHLMADTFARLIKDNKDAKMVMTFMVNEVGMMQEVVFSGSFDEKILASGMSYIEALNKKKLWKPATLNGVPVYQRFRLPIRQKFDFEQELTNPADHNPALQPRNSF